MQRIMPKTQEETKYLTCAETAKLVRQALKVVFPGIKFSVRSNTYSGGASIDVGWFNGPTENEVKKITDRYEGADFDGMIDRKTYHTSTLIAEDGTARKVHHGADFIFTNRHYSFSGLTSENSFIQVMQDLCKLQRIKYQGYYTLYLLGGNDREDLRGHTNRLLRITSFNPDEDYSGIEYAEENSNHWCRVIKIKK